MLKGESVILRALTRDDLPRLQAEFDQRVSHGGRDGSDFAIETEGKFIGICGLFNFDVNAHPCEPGIMIGDKDYWGRGYGREEVSLFLDYAFRLRNFHKVWRRSHVWSGGSYDDLVYMGVLHKEWPPNP